MTRLGYFWKFLNANLLTKLAKKLSAFIIIFKKSLFIYKLLWLHSGQRLEKLGYFLFHNLVTLKLVNSMLKRSKHNLYFTVRHLRIVTQLVKCVFSPTYKNNITKTKMYYDVSFKDSLLSAAPAAAYLPS